MRRRPSEALEQRKVENWNARYPVGKQVLVEMDSGEVRHTRTIARAEVFCGTAVVWLEGITGCYALSHVQPV